jgi:hypothetical protein
MKTDNLLKGDAAMNQNELQNDLMDEDEYATQIMVKDLEPQSEVVGGSNDNLILNGTNSTTSSQNGNLQITQFNTASGSTVWNGVVR